MNNPPKLSTIPLIRQLASTIQATESVSGTLHLPRGSVKGVVVDVDDPMDRGRVKVIFENMSPDTPQVTGAGEASEERTGQPDVSHWIDVSPAFKGKQPKGLVGKKVSINVANGEYQYAILGDVIYDPQNQTEKSAEEFKMPNNSSMTRLPVYEPDEIPPPSEENHGCVIIENNGPMSGDWICTCVKRDGKYYWVRLADLAHGHAGGNDGGQQVDSLGNRQNPIMQGTTGDNVFPTTHQQFNQQSGYTTKPQGNPKGQQAHWYPAPQSGDTYKEGSNFTLINPAPDPSLSLVRDPAGFLPISASIAEFAPVYNPSISSILSPDAKTALQKAQDIYQTVNQVISDPTSYVSNLALRNADSFTAGLGVPPGTDQAISTIQNAAGTLEVTLPTPRPPASVSSYIQNIFKMFSNFRFP